MAPAVEIAVRGTTIVYGLVDGASVTVGRVAQCEIHIDDQSVSRRHCTLALRGEALLVTDLESANGTFINDRPVKSASAGPGDLIRVGSTVLEYRDPGALRRGGTARVVADAESTMQSVVRKRIEPAEVDWLSSATSALPALSLLQRAQRHLKTLHRVSEVLAGARDLQALADAALETILDVTAADRAALVLRRDGTTSGEADVAAARLASRIAAELGLGAEQQERRPSREMRKVNQQRLRPERGPNGPRESVWGWGPKRIEKC